MNRLHVLVVLFLISLCASAQEQFSVYFETNKYQLTAAEQARLTKWIVENKTSKILAINGYTDEDGSVGLNDTLSERRVSTVFGLIKGKLRIREDFMTRSFGKLHKHDAVKAKNRKAVIYYLLEKDLAKENEILGIKDEPGVVKKPVKVEFPASITVTTPAGKEEMKLDVAFMERINTAKTGEKIVIPNLNFRENTFAVMNESRPRLYELLQVMKTNANLKIKLQGHVCCMTKDRQDLSTQRAKAVMMFLLANGIEKSRLSFQGFGVSQPLYPIPEKTPEEREANRRVEVLIVENI
jgi:outer membrane protein OmpA-like peptidoglycan-associated protein